MKFRVRWADQALNQLAELWNQADSAGRQQITHLAHLLDQRPSGDPYRFSESRPQARRITFIPPLAATYQIESDGMTVSVLHIRLYRKRRP